MKNIRGFIDLHTHGLGRFDTKSGSARDVLNLAALHGRAGVSAILPAIYPASMEKMRANIRAVAEAMGCEEKTSARVLGVHLEGPFLNPVRAGALDKGAFLAPSLSSLRKLIAGFEDIIKIITVAPEMKGALKLIARCAGLGMRVSMGHSDATLKEALSGKKAGASGVTHLFNAMRPFHHREPGLAGLGLLDDELYVEVIANGVHLSPEALRLVFRVKPAERIILVSDSVRGPVKKKGVIQGGRGTLAVGVEVLRGLGVSEKAIRLAARENPGRYVRGTVNAMLKQGKSFNSNIFS